MMRIQWSGAGGLEFIPETDFEKAILLHLQHVLMGNVKMTLEPGGARPDLPNPALQGTEYDRSARLDVASTVK